jgi:hypothetical protein
MISQKKCEFYFRNMYTYLIYLKIAIMLIVYSCNQIQWYAVKLNKAAILTALLFLSSRASSGLGGGLGAPPPGMGGIEGPDMLSPKPASYSDEYDCVEEDISEQQVQRMVQKSVFSNKLNARYKKKF